MHRVIDTIELPPIPIADGAPLRFRIEVLERLGDASTFSARLQRWETFELRPFSRGVGSSHESILVLDEFWDWEAQAAPSPAAALDAVLDALRRQLPNAEIPRLSSGRRL